MDQNHSTIPKPKTGYQRQGGLCSGIKASAPVHRAFSFAGNSFKFFEIQKHLRRVIIKLFVDAIRSLGLSQCEGVYWKEEGHDRQIFSILPVLRNP